MNRLYRSIALLAFSVVFANLAQAQTYQVTEKLDAPQTIQAQETGLLQSEAAPQVPLVDVFQNPGERSIHVSVNRLTGGATMNIVLIAPNNRVIRSRSVYLCTLCGTFDIDLDDELSVGRHIVTLEANGMVISRTVWVE